MVHVELGYVGGVIELNITLGASCTPISHQLLLHSCLGYLVEVELDILSSSCLLPPNLLHGCMFQLLVEVGFLSLLFR